MRQMTLSLSRWAWALAILVPLAACDGEPSPEVQSQIDELETARDSLARELATQNERMQRLGRTIEAATEEIGEPSLASPEELEDRVTAMAEELVTARDQLADAQRRARALSSRSMTLRDSLNDVITEKDEALAAQRDSIAGIADSLRTVSSRADELESAHAELEETLDQLQARYYTAYVAVGTKDELLDQGVVEEEGGARVLLVLWRAGATLVPARDLDAEPFEAIDLRETDAIELPAPGTYRLVSRHNTEYLDPTPDEDGRFSGDALRITDPMEFWQASRYLIIVRD